MTEIQRLFIKNMRSARSRTGISQSALADRCGLSSNYIAELEAGRRFPSHETLQKICDVFCLRPYQLFIDETIDFVPLSNEGEGLAIKSHIKRRLKELLDELG